MRRCVSPVSVISDLSSRDKWAAIREVINRSSSLAGPFRRQLERAVIAREHISSTAMGHGIALSHGELPGLSSLLLGVGLSRPGIEFGSVDRKPVHLLFVFATPPDGHFEYLQTLATICRLGRQGCFAVLWENATGREEIERILKPALDPLHSRSQT